jgi:DNA repair protein RadC
LLLNRGNKVLGWANISNGGITGTVADPLLIFQTALLTNATSIILSHNHPSGNRTPSSADIDLTRKVKSAGQILEIMVLDHVIVTTDGYYSFADEGII